MVSETAEVIIKIKAIADLKAAENAGKQFAQLRKKFDSFGGAMRMPTERWAKFNKQGGKFNSLGGRIGNRLRLMTHGLRGFRMEMLGVMFFGMGMTKFIKGLISPSLKMVGVFEIFSTALGILFLPIALKIMDWALKFLDWVLEMNPAAQAFINKIAGWGLIIGGILQTIGTFALGIGSIIQAFGGMFALGLLPWWAKLGLAVLAVVAYFTDWGGVATWMNEKFGNLITFITELLDKFIQLEGVQAVLSSLGLEGNTFAEVMESVKDKVLGYWDDIKLGISNSVAELVKFVTDKFKEMGTNLRTLLLGGTPLPSTAAKQFFGSKGFIEKIPGAIPEGSFIVEGKKKAGLLTPLIEKFKLFREGLEEYDWEKINRGFGILLDLITGIADAIAYAVTNFPNFARYNKEIAKQYEPGIRDIRDVFDINAPVQQGSPFVPHTGLYKLHAGERVSQAGSIGDINITTTVSATENVDIDLFISKIGEQLAAEVDNVRRR